MKKIIWNRSVETPRLELRYLKNSDYSTWFDAYACGLPKQNKWDDNPKPPSFCLRKDFERLRRRLLQLARADRYYRYYVFEKEHQTMVGLVDFDIFARGSHQFANFGYRIFNRYWRMGFGSEAGQKGLEIGFEHLELHRLEAAILERNSPSIKLARRIGMKKECMRKKYWFEDKVWKDHLIYVAIPEDLGFKPSNPHF